MPPQAKVFCISAAVIGVLATGTFSQARVLVTPSRELAVAASVLVALQSDSLLIPIESVTASQLVDTWSEARGENRPHQGIDITAPLGTPVRAAAKGEILKFFDSKLGGITIYEMDDSKQFIFYYAHLQAREGGFREGDSVAQGQLIGYVGATGNAMTPHLHFEIQHAPPDGAWWRGTAFNPYSSLVAGRVRAP